MKKVFLAFKLFLSQISHDFMLVACLSGPIFMGAMFRFALPILEIFLCGYFQEAQILAPYYIIFDLILATITPILFCFAGVFVILEEIDCGTAKYYSVTPLGKRGYFISRIEIPAVLAFIYDILLLAIFSVANINSVMIFFLSAGGTLLALITSIFVVAFAKNKIEGMALAKLCGLFIVGIPVAYFITSPIRYIFGFLPSFWMAELCITGNYLFFLLAILFSCLMILGLWGRFEKKLL